MNITVESHLFLLSLDKFESCRVFSIVLTMLLWSKGNLTLCTTKISIGNHCFIKLSFERTVWFYSLNHWQMIERMQVKPLYVAIVLADLSKCLKWNLPLVFQSPAAWPQWNRGILFWEWKWEWRWGGAAGHPGGFAETERGTGGRIWFLAFSGSLLWWLHDCTGAEWLCASVFPRLVSHTELLNHCWVGVSPCCCLGQQC